MHAQRAESAIDDPGDSLPETAPATRVAPLDATRRRLARTFRLFAFETKPDIDDPHWISIAAASDPARLTERLDAVAAHYVGHRDVAAAYIAMRYAGVVAVPLIGAYLAEHRVPLAEPATAFVRCDDDLEFSRIAIGHSRFAALAHDPSAAHHDARVVTDGEALADMLADALHHLIEPVLEAVRPLAPVGRRGLWGLTADAIGGGALAAARETGRDHRPLWASAIEILDRLQERGLPVHNRPRPLVVSCDGHDFPFNIRGTCCLRYKSSNHRDHHDPDFGAYCHSCPLVDDDTLYRHYVDNAQERLQHAITS